ncbi:MAG: hypothetical protein EBZ75_13550, partial [Oxalobacteraceae bacterium]|nr:hypothetical protein [Oxalobacteraceae bacterium]
MRALHFLSQTVSQVTAEQQGQNVVVHYQLLTETPCEVSLLVSLDRGNTWSEPLGHCTGDVGENIGTGAHSITWNVLADRTELWGDGIRFRVKAVSMRIKGATHTCGLKDVLNPNLTYGTMTDQEGNVYKTIVIGTQEWMAENLNTSIYRNGDAIPTNIKNSQWRNTTSGAW